MSKNDPLYKKDRIQFSKMFEKTYNHLCDSLLLLENLESRGECLESDYGGNYDSDALYGVKMQLQDDLEAMQKSLTKHLKAVKKL